MQTIGTKVLFITLLFPAVILPTMMQASEELSKKERRVENEAFFKINKILFGNDDPAVKEEKLDQLKKEGVNIDARKVCYSGWPTNFGKVR